MFVFIDFDGTMHPAISLTEPIFFRLELFEYWLRKWPCIKVVISSSWREQHPFDEMQSYLSEDLQERIIRATPVITHLDKLGLGERPPLRQIEIGRWLVDNDDRAQPWVAFDDDGSLFRRGRFNLVICDPTVGLSTATLDVAEERLGLQEAESATLEPIGPGKEDGELDRDAIRSEFIRRCVASAADAIRNGTGIPAATVIADLKAKLEAARRTKH